MDDVLIVGVTGKLGTGKNWYISNVIIPILEKQNKRFLETAFADQIKITTMTEYKTSYNDVYIKKTAQSRQYLQNIGTIGRNKDVNLWIDYISNWIIVYKNRNINIFLISDCRYINEFNFIKNNNGIIIKMNAPKRNNERLIQESCNDNNMYDKIKNHISECDLDDFTNDKFNLVINNDDIHDINILQSNFETQFNLMNL